MAPDRSRLDPVQLEQLHGLRVLACGDLDLVAALAEQRDQRPEDEHVRRVGHVDPDAHPQAHSNDEARLDKLSFMDTRQLAAFCEVVERRSFSEAAARLGVTQPAV